MNTFTLVGLLIGVALVANFAFAVLRKPKVKEQAGVPLVHRKLGLAELVINAMMVASWAFALALPIVQPQSWLAQALSQKWALLSFVAWSMLVAVVFRGVWFIAARVFRGNGKRA